jgi:hypothetical protein
MSFPGPSVSQGLAVSAEGFDRGLTKMSSASTHAGEALAGQGKELPAPHGTCHLCQLPGCEVCCTSEDAMMVTLSSVRASLGLACRNGGCIQDLQIDGSSCSRCSALST